MESTPFPSQRTLAAIVFTDAVSFSARMSENEAQTLRLINRDLELMREYCQRFQGQVLKSTGDGLLMYFLSATEAVTCALEIQKNFLNLATKQPPSEVLSHRIGIHLGDVFLHNNDVMGNGVNIAARLQTEAEPGGICISQTVYDVVKNDLSLQANFLGERELKNIRCLVPIYQILLASSLQGSRQFAQKKDTASRQEYRYREILINKVRNFWIKGVLETSLHDKAQIVLGLAQPENVLQRPWGIVEDSEESVSQPLPSETRVIDKFMEMGTGRTLLILGEPGSGKTTTLLELAKDLLTEAELNFSLPIPVILNLSSWEGQDFAKWLMIELHSKYQVSEDIANRWVQQQQLLLLLDGLDEIVSEKRQDCVHEINDFLQSYGQTEMVVCSRFKDYQAFSTRLSLQSAISIQPLNSDQIQHYLRSLDADLSGIINCLEKESELQGLLSSPLMLNIITLAYHGVTVGTLPCSSSEQFHSHLFKAYTERMFRRRMVSPLYSREKTLYWLSWLAKQMQTRSQTVFMIEQIQPSWLTPRQRKLYQISQGIAGMVILGLCGIILFSASRGAQQGLIAGIIFALAGLTGGTIFGLVSSDKIEPATSLQWSWEKVRQNLLSGLVVGAIAALILGVSGAILNSFNYGWNRAWFYGLSYGFTGLGMGVIFILLKGLTGSGIEISTFPNQGIHQSVKNSLLFNAIGITTLGILTFAIGLPIIVGIILGLLFGLLSPGGIACIQHFLLRLIAYSYGYIPWNYARFLDYATQLIFLQKVGGGYIFIHRLLLEYFAEKINDDK